MAEQLQLIPRVESGEIIPQRMSDGYINATALCKSVGKSYSDYRQLQSTNHFLNELKAQTGLSEQQLIQQRIGGEPSLQGSWVHPYLAINLAQWLSPAFAVKVSTWVHEWMSGKVNASPSHSAHIQRYLQNRGKIPYTHFSMLNEITLNLIAPLEEQGYILPSQLVPDISEGRLFCRWLRENRNVDPNNFPTYTHEFLDGRRPVEAKLYPIEYYQDFKWHFNEVWLKEKAKQYFSERDAAILPYLTPLMLPASES